MTVSSWINTSEMYALAPMPGGKEEHGFEACNGKLYAVGGGNLTGESPKKLYEYNPTTNIWSTKSDLPFAEAYRESAIWRAVGTKLYFIGGLTATGNLHANVYEYNTANDTWTTKTSMPTAREDFGSAVYNGKIYCFGGIKATFPTPTNVMEVYDPSNDTWDETKADLPANKLLGDFGATCNGKIYAVGGTNTMTGYPTLAPVTTVYEYDPVGDSWSTKTAIPVSTCYKEVEVIGNYLYVVSGAGAGDFNTVSNLTNAIYRYDTVGNSWTLLGEVAPYASLGSALAVLDGKIYMCGGGYNGLHNNLYRLRLP